MCLCVQTGQKGQARAGFLTAPISWRVQKRRATVGWVCVGGGIRSLSAPRVPHPHAHTPSPPPTHSHQPAPEDEDLILAKALQEQEHALSLLAGQGGLTGAWGAGGALGAGEEEEEEADGDDLAPREGEDDAAYAARLQAAEDRANYLALAGLGPGGAAAGGGLVGEADEGGEGAAAGPPATAVSGDLLAGTDPAALSYEQLNALGDIAGSGPRGAAPDAVAALPVEVFGEGAGGDGCGAGAGAAPDPAGACCVVCQCDYEAGDRLARLPCGHRYHAACAAEALAVRKACPLCGKEVE